NGWRAPVPRTDLAHEAAPRRRAAHEGPGEPEQLGQEDRHPEELRGRDARVPHELAERGVEGGRDRDVQRPGRGIGAARAAVALVDHELTAAAQGSVVVDAAVPRPDVEQWARQ